MVITVGNLKLIQSGVFLTKKNMEVFFEKINDVDKLKLNFIFDSNEKYRVDKEVLENEIVLNIFNNEDAVEFGFFGQKITDKVILSLNIEVLEATLLKLEYCFYEPLEEFANE